MFFNFARRQFTVFAVQCCKLTAIKHYIVCRTALSERRICIHKSSLRWSINNVNTNRVALVVMVTKIWDSASNNEIIVPYGLLWQKDWADTVFAYLVMQTATGVEVTIGNYFPEVGNIARRRHVPPRLPTV